MLKVSGLDVNIGPTPILRGLTLEVPAGTMCGLIGRNGAGKTTFLRAVMGALAAVAGEVMFGHQDLLKVHPHKRAHMGIGFMPEDRRLVPALTAEENILLPVWATGMEDWQDRLAWIYELMPEVAEFRRRGSLELSGGAAKVRCLRPRHYGGYEIIAAGRTKRRDRAGFRPAHGRNHEKPEG